MSKIIKRIIRIFNGTDWDKYYPETSADQVIYTKPDGTVSTAQVELDAQNSALKLDYINPVDLLERNSKISGTNQLRAYKKNGIVTLHLNVSISENLSAGENLFKLPNGFQPAFIVQDYMCDNTQDTVVTIRDNGYVSLSKGWNKATWITKCITYMAK